MLGNTDLDLDQSHVAYLNFLKYYNYSVEALNERRGEKRIDLRLVRDRLSPLSSRQQPFNDLWTRFRLLLP